MEATAFMALVLSCAPQVHFDTARALVSTESNFNPWGTARALARDGRNFSVGLGQINVTNFDRLGLSLESAFDPCTNLAAMQTVLVECLERAARAKPTANIEQHTVQRALSCYYSGNFTTGFRHGYVHKVLRAAARAKPTLPPPPTKESP
jgi:type IV secretion system protein VirB1